MFSAPSFLAYVLVCTFTPGPNNLMSMGNAGRVGLKKSLPFCLGVMVGFLLVMALCLLAGELLYAVLPSVKPYLLVLGAAYILYLAWKIYKSDGVHGAEKSSTGFFTAVLLQFVNPKGVIYGLTAASVYILPFYRDPGTLAFFAAFMALVCLISTVAWAGFGSAFKRLFVTHARAVNTVMALLLVYCAVSLFF